MTINTFTFTQESVTLELDDKIFYVDQPEDNTFTLYLQYNTFIFTGIRDVSYRAYGRKIEFKHDGDLSVLRQCRGYAHSVEYNREHEPIEVRKEALLFIKGANLCMTKTNFSNLSIEPKDTKKYNSRPHDVDPRILVEDYAGTIRSYILLGQIEYMKDNRTGHVPLVDNLNKFYFKGITAISDFQEDVMCAKFKE